MTKEKSSGISIKKIFCSLLFALRGIQRAWHYEQSFRHEVLFLLLLCILLYFFTAPPLWWGLLLGSWLLVMALELLNSAIEEVFDYISPQYSDAAKHGKDMAAGAIFLGILLHILLWLCFFLNKLF